MLGTVIGPCVFHIHIVSGVLASLKVPIILVSNLAMTVVIFDPPARQNPLTCKQGKGITSADSATGGWELGDHGTDIQDVLQQHYSKIFKALKAFANNCSALANVPVNLGEAITELILVHLGCQPSCNC